MMIIMILHACMTYQYTSTEELEESYVYVCFLLSVCKQGNSEIMNRLQNTFQYLLLPSCNHISLQTGQKQQDLVTYLYISKDITVIRILPNSV